MARSSRSTSWWETFLWVGIFLIALIFLYQLLKLWNAGVATADSFFASVGQAVGNTITAVENGLLGLVTTPSAVLNALFSGAPILLSLVYSFFSSLLTGGLFSTIIGFFTTILSSATGVNTNQGSGYPSTTVNPQPVVPATGVGFSAGQ